MITRRDIIDLVLCLLVLAALGVCYFNRTPSGPVEPHWLAFNPDGADDSHGRLEDCFSRLIQKYKTEVSKNDKFGPPDKPNVCHEATHYIISMLRCADDPKNENNDAVYIDHGRYLLFDHPKVTLKQVQTYLTEDERTHIRDVMETWENWDKEPLYILDEWCAYSNGTICAKEVDAPAPRIEMSRNHMMRCGVIAEAFIKCIEEHDPSYAQLADLKEFVAWQQVRATTIFNETEPCSK